MGDYWRQRPTTLDHTANDTMGQPSALRIWAPTFASSEKFTILGGFVSSLLFFFSLLIIGNLKERESGWLQVFVSLAIAMGAAATVHRVCVTTCFLFSMGLLYWMVQVSQSFHKKALEANVATKKRR